INEGGAAQEANNTATITLNVQPPLGYVAMLSPTAGQTLEPGSSLSVTGYVRDQSTNNGISGVGLTIELRQGAAVLASNTTVTQSDGFFLGTVNVPSGLADGPYDVVVTPSSGIIGPQTQSITVKKTLPFLSSPVSKLRQEASRELGRDLSDRDFQELWKKQPTFLTFEDWLREEEEMRKMGSKPCPTCGTLNSVTANVCHKCGSLMREVQRPPTGGGGGATVVQVPSTARQPVRGTAPSETPAASQ